MSHSKRDAGDALSRLRDWLRNDTKGRDMLSAVQQYHGQLRNERSTLKTDLEALRGTCAALREANAQAHSELERLRTEKDTSQSMAAQLQRDLSKARADLARIDNQAEEALEAAFADVGGDLDGTERRWFALVRRLVREMPRIPKPTTASLRSVDCTVFKITVFVRDYSVDECLTVGLLTVAMATADFPVAFEPSDDAMEMIHTMAERGKKRMGAWLHKQKLIDCRCPECLVADKFGSENASECTKRKCK